MRNHTCWLCDLEQALALWACLLTTKGGATLPPSSWGDYMRSGKGRSLAHCLVYRVAQKMLVFFIFPSKYLRNEGVPLVFVGSERSQWEHLPLALVPSLASQTSAFPTPNHKPGCGLHMPSTSLHHWGLGLRLKRWDSQPNSSLPASLS